MTRTFSVTVNYRHPEDTIACVRSLLRAGAKPGEVVVVDNGSGEESLERLRAGLQDNIALLVSPENLGYARGANLGVKYALEKGAEWVFLLNNDTVVDRDLFRAFRTVQSDHPALALLGPSIYYFDHPDRMWFLGHRRVPGTLLTYDLKHLTRLGNWLTRAQWIPADFLSGCAVLIRRDVFDRVGLFDGSLFMYGEEVDFCWRALRLGFRAGCVPAAKLWHKVSLSASGDGPVSTYYRIRNQAIFYRRYGSALGRPLYMGFTILRACAIGLRLAGEPGSADYLVMSLTAWLDGWRDRRGRYDELHNRSPV